MKPEHLIIEMIRDRLRDAWNEYADAKAIQAHEGLTAARDPGAETEAKYRRAITATSTAYMGVKNWDAALSVALDKLFS